MKKRELAALLRCVSVETGSLLCLGCGYEHDCSIHGCTIIRWASDALDGADGLTERLQAENTDIRQNSISHAAHREIVDGMAAEIERLRKELDWKEKVIELAQRTEKRTALENADLCRKLPEKSKLLDKAVEDLKQSIFSDSVNSCTFCKYANPDKNATPYCLANFCENGECEWRGGAEK